MPAPKKRLPPLAAASAQSLCAIAFMVIAHRLWVFVALRICLLMEVLAPR
ncbi:hypothetical protein [Vandammella animalimorsus]|nr:hypothetical protein [Vandammella animalimorsus]